MLDMGLPAHWGDTWKSSAEHLLSRSLSLSGKHLLSKSRLQLLGMRSEFCTDLKKTQYLLPCTSFVNFSDGISTASELDYI